MQDFDIAIVLTIDAHSRESAIAVAESIVKRLEDEGEVAEVREDLIPIPDHDLSLSAVYQPRGKNDN